jgi:type IV pilus assembly protein PilB
VLGGEKVAIRMLEKDKLVRGLTELGLSKKSLTVFRDILSKPRGIVLVTGPTGAGKTTTLYSALAHLGSPERNILTVEDPVEYQIPTIRQTQIRPKAGFMFGTAIRSLLRQDPDVIMIGEIRDPETAQLALRAACRAFLSSARCTRRIPPVPCPGSWTWVWSRICSPRAWSA